MSLLILKTKLRDVKYMGYLNFNNLSTKAEDKKETVKPKQPKKNKAFDESTKRNNFVVERANLFVMKYKEIQKRKIEFNKEEQEEFDRIVLEYNRHTSKLNNMYESDISNKSWLQGEALRALPEHLKEHANKKVEGPVRDRPDPIWLTPPIKGFKFTDYVKASDIEEENN